MELRNRLGDALFSRSAHAASKGAFAALNGIQDVEHPADQLIGLACAFNTFARVCGVAPMTLLHMVERMEADCRFREVNTLSAVQRFAENEVRKKLP